MSGVFDAYAAYYELLYHDKPYAAEAAWVNAALATAPARLLEIGCGTGAHAYEMAALGWSVTGVDLSAAMVATAQARLARETPPQPLAFHQGDARQLPEVGGEFDAAISLFHVVSYLNTDADVMAAFRGVAARLKPGGRFLFDVWHGPGVLQDPPAERVREIAGKDIEVTRRATPTHYTDTRIINVHFDVEVRHAGGSEQLAEDHRMRYFFLPELAELLQLAGLRFVEGRRWLADGEPGAADWYACVIAERPHA